MVSPHRREILTACLLAGPAALFLPRSLFAEDAAEAKEQEDKKDLCRSCSSRRNKWLSRSERVRRRSPVGSKNRRLSTTATRCGACQNRRSGSGSKRACPRCSARSSGSPRPMERRKRGSIVACLPRATKWTSLGDGNFRWRSRDVSIQWMPLAGAQPPRDQARARLTQMKSMAREFSGHTEQTPTNSRQEMRLLSEPVASVRGAGAERC